MGNERHITFLRISFWVGAVVDALVIIPLLSPDVSQLIFEMSGFAPTREYAYVSRIAASLMAG